MIKRSFDLMVSTLTLIIMLPLMMLISILVKLDSKGPILYKGVRVGRHGKLFKMFKFRTMIVNAEKLGGPSSADDDPRITKVGHLIRKSKVDELPQLINILKGEMSFVGPRPEVPLEVETYTEEEKKILLVKPGITDWASLKYHNEGEILRGSPDPHKTYREKIKPGKMRLALKYVDEKSFLTDIKIISITFLTLIKTRVQRG